MDNTSASAAGSGAEPFYTTYDPQPPQAPKPATDKGSSKGRGKGQGEQPDKQDKEKANQN